MSDADTIDSSYENHLVKLASGWNDKKLYNNIELSSLNTFVRLYLIVNDEEQNLLNNLSNNNIDVLTLISDDEGLNNKKIVEISSYLPQIKSDMGNANLRNAGGIGINNLKVERSNREAFTIRYRLSLTITDPKLIDERTDLSKLIQLSSDWIIAYGWDGFRANNIAPAVPNIVNQQNQKKITYNLSDKNNGYWDWNYAKLYKFNFNITNEGHLQGSLEFSNADSININKASNFTPQVGDDRKVTSEGVTKVNSDAYFYLPTGDTASRETTGTYNTGTRGLYSSFQTPDTSTYDTIEYLTIASLGSVNDFGNLTNQKINQVACSSVTRGLFASGYTPSPASGNNFIDFVTIMSTGNAQDFGDLSYVTYVPNACSNQTRGIIAGGAAAPSYAGQTNMDYVTIASKGNGKDFGDLTRARHSLSGLSSPTRGVFASGNANPVSNLNNIDYVTIASTGNAQDFGDIGTGRAGPAGASSAIRGLFAGGYNPSVLNSIDFITIATTGNTQDFGDLTAVRRFAGGTSSSIRAVFMAGYNPAATNTIDFVSIQTTGNATDFGDTTINKTQADACSNGHGGLG